MDKDRRANFLRKLHSFAGVFPLGIFLCFHMCVNYSANWGTTPYDTMGSFMAHMPYKVVLETFVIFLPLLFHALYGVYISLTSSVTVKRYRYFRNWCYVLQRIAGIVTLLFVVWHIYGTKLQVELTGVDPSYAMVAGIVATPIGLALFAIGLLCCIYHFCNGLWTFLITWGITVSPRSQKNIRLRTVRPVYRIRCVWPKGTVRLCRLNPHATRKRLLWAKDQSQLLAEALRG